MKKLNLTLEIENHQKGYELQNIINAFELYMNSDPTYRIISKFEEGKCSAEVFVDEISTAKSTIDLAVDIFTNEDRQNLVSKALKKALYIAMSQFTGRQLPWGTLTGIRPTKIVHQYMAKGYSKIIIKKLLIEDYCISREKVKLMMYIAEKEDEILSRNKEDEIALYIGIPFCPTRCLYCSFTSYPLDRKKDQVEAYLDALIKEINCVGKIVEDKIVGSIYIGGGTPTSLNECQLEKLLLEISNSFNMENLKEYTVEAGRPDTITREKLRNMKKYGIDRISINPQTMNQKTLQLIGRKHQVEDINNVFHMARQEGHTNINMDLIVGLPGEMPEDVIFTIKKVKELNPESITVHTMAIKRASLLKETLDDYNLASESDIEKMLEITAKGAKDMGMDPYYMYRQKDIMGNFENVGYATSGNECIYNVQMIAEQQTIIAMGAGAITKVVSEGGKTIKRIPNVKNLEDYIGRVEEMIERKISHI